MAHSFIQREEILFKVERTDTPTKYIMERYLEVCVFCTDAIPRRALGRIIYFLEQGQRITRICGLRAVTFLAEHTVATVGSGSMEKDIGLQNLRNVWLKKYAATATEV